MHAHSCLCANARVQAKHTLVQTQSAQKVLRERCVTRHVEVARGGPASPVVPSHVGRTRRARGERDRLGQACACVLILSGSYPSAKWGLLETTGFHHSPQHSPGGGGATLSLSIAKEPKLCPAKGPAPTHDAGERRGRRKTRLPSDINSPSFSGVSDFRAFPLLRQDLTWPERRMDWEGRATTDSQMCPVWPAQLIRGRLFARRV